MSTEDKLTRAIRGKNNLYPMANVAPDRAAARVREAFVVIDREKVQRQVDTVWQYDGVSSYDDDDARTVPRIKSGAAHVDVRAGADHARDMAVHYLALAQWIDEHPPVDEKAVDELQDALIAHPFVPHESARSLARSLVADGWTKP